MQQKETLAKSEEELNEKEVKIRADELLKEAAAKLKSALETKTVKQAKCDCCPDDVGNCYYQERKCNETVR